MSAFDNGFNFGMRAFQQALDNKRQEEFDARSKQEHGWKEDDRKRVEEQRAQEDDAWKNIERPSGAVAPAAPVDANTPGAAMAVGGLSSSGGTQAQAGGGTPAPTLPSSVQESIAAQGSSQSPRVAQLKAMQGIAIARRDMGSLERLGRDLQTAEEDDFIAQSIKRYRGADDQVGATAQHINSTSKTISMGDPDKNGVVRLSVVTPDRRAQFLKLGQADQARLFAAAQLMERNPTRAYEMIASVSKPLADAVAAENGVTAKVADSNNNAASKERDDARADRQLAETGRHNRATESIAAAKGAANPGGLGREERMRYTSLLGETSRRITEAQKTLAALQKEPMYSMAKPGSPQQIELQGLRDSIAALTEERKTYQGMLAGSQAPNSPPAATAGGAAGTGGKPSWQPDEVHSDQVRVIQGELEKALAPGGRNEDVPALQRELKRLGVEPGSACWCAGKS